MKATHTFNAGAVDYFGYVSIRQMMREINEVVAHANYEDGVGFSRVFPEYGITWMMGQCVLEMKKLLPCVEEVVMETGGHEHFGVGTVRRCTMHHKGELAMNFTTKLLPVYAESRKVVPPQVMQPLWYTPAAPNGENIPFLQLPENMELVELLQVHYRDCDSNGHMNAYCYVDLVLEAVGYWQSEPCLAERIQIDYKRECLPGDMLQLLYGEADGIRYCSGVKTDGTVSFNAAVKLSEQQYHRAEIIHV